MYKLILRPLLFLINPESVHKIIVSFLKMSFCIPGIKEISAFLFEYKNQKIEKKVFGLKFKNPVGLAAGFDKNASFYNELSAFGFSFIEIGTVTPKPQPGNPKPRIFRLIKDNALINRMGFNNKGVLYVQKKLLNRRDPKIIIGGNIGKNTATPNVEAVNDYLFCFNALYEYVDYIVINISCPNIKDLRDLQNGEEVKTILEAIILERNKKELIKPILLKVSPDLTNEQLDETISIAEECGIDGYVATNTTTSRENLVTDFSIIEKIGQGGLSGLPLQKRSNEVISLIHKKTNGKKPIIGTGGIMSETDAYEKLKAGASLIQIYSGFIYTGPFLVKRINKYLTNNSL